jgi:probable F420-dependent oxidoreductase
MQIGAVVRLGPVPEGGDPPRFSAVAEMARRMEASGLDSLWVFDHLLYRWPGRPTDGIWEAWTTLTALAMATQRVELGTLVLCTPFRNPALLAKMATTLDEISAGRLILGLGAGWHEPEFDAFGVPFDHRVGRLDEALQIISPLLKTGRVDFDGHFYSARACELIPRGPRPSGPPLMVAGHGPRMLRLIARQADSWNCAWHASADSARPAINEMRAVCEQQGRDPDSLSLTISVPLAYPDLGEHGSRSQYLGGSNAEVADALHGLAELGAQHVMIEFWPYSPAALERLASAVETYRGASR